MSGYRAILLLLALAASAAPAPAATVGQLAGRVFDLGGGAVADVSVVARNIGSGIEHRTTTGNEGAFRFPLLPVGEYRVTATHPQFRAIQTFAIVVGAQIIELELKFSGVAARSETVTVRSEPLALDSTGAGVHAGFTGRQVAETPGASDSLLALVSRTSTAWFSQEHLHIRGAHQVAYQVNGIDVPDLSLFGAVTPLIDPRNVNFTEVTTGGLLPEYGNRTAGVVNAVARSGFDEGARRGEIELAGGNLKRASAFAAYGGRVGRGEQALGYYLQGGALASGRGFNPPPDAIAPGAILLPPGDQTRHNFRRTYQGFGNFDYRQNAANHWNFTAGSYRTDLQIPNTLEQHSFGRDYAQFERDRFLNLRWNHAPAGGAGLLSLSGFYHHNAVAVEGRHDAPFVPLASDRRHANYFGWRADFSHARRGHLLKTGWQSYAARVQDRFDVLRSDRPPVCHDRPEACHYNSNIASRGAEHSAYAQDQWIATRRLTLTYGARLDHFRATYLRATRGADARRDSTFLSPRLGLAYRLGRAVLFGNFGYVFLPPPLEFFEIPDSALFPQGAAFVPVKPERDVQYDAGIKFQLAGFRVRANQWFKRQIGFLDHVQLSQLNGRELINPNIFLPVNLDRGRTHGAELMVESPRRGGLSFFLNYAYNRAQAYGGIVGGFSASGFGAGREFEPRYFSLDHDQRHAGFAGVTWRHDRTRTFVTGLYAYGSGFPDASGEMLAPFFGGEPTCARHGCRLPPHHTLSFSVGQSLGEWLTLRLEVENVTNSVYPINLGSEFNGSHFSAPRQAALRLTWRF